MKYAKLNLGSVAVIALMIAACNSNPSTDKIADTASMPAYTTPEQPTAATNGSGDTSSIQNNAPATNEKPKTAITAKRRKVVIETGPAAKSKKLCQIKTVFTPIQMWRRCFRAGSLP